MVPSTTTDWIRFPPTGISLFCWLVGWLVRVRVGDTKHAPKLFGYKQQNIYKQVKEEEEKTVYTEKSARKKKKKKSAIWGIHSHTTTTTISSR